MRHYFNECPDCGEYYGKYGRMPNLERNEKVYFNDYFIVKNGVKAVCDRCGWETKLHDNVGQCAKEWNSTKLYGEDVEEELDYGKEADSLAISMKLLQ